MEEFHPKSTRSNRPEVFYKKGVLKNFAKFTGKHLCRNLFLIKLKAFSKISKNIFFTEHLRMAASNARLNNQILKLKLKYFRSQEIDF